MSLLRFKNTEADKSKGTNSVRRLIKSMLESNERRKPYSPNPTSERGVSMVKDDGIYLINIGVKDHWLEGPVSNFSVFAEGYDPTMRAEAPGDWDPKTGWSDPKRYHLRHDGVWTDGDKEEYESLTALQKATHAVAIDTEHVWDDCQAAVGGDDFAIWVPLENEQVDQLLKSNDPQIILDWGKTSYKIQTQ
tara:strand:- start:939 stop:1511 length:573 start_codon:yes stop_codon:yes gene_type:complete